jgi:hypothetical protein
MSTETENGKIALRNYIRENYQLIASIGVFGALTTLFTRLENAPYLSFVTFAMFFILTWEFVDSFPDMEKSSMRFIAFEMLTMILMIFVGLYIFTTYITAFWKLFVFLSMLVLYSAISIALSQRFKLYSRIQRRIPEGRLRSISKMALLLISTIALVLVSIFSANYIIDLIDALVRLFT